MLAYALQDVRANFLPDASGRVVFVAHGT